MVPSEAVSTKSALVAVVVVAAVAVGGVTVLAESGETGAAVEQVPAGVDTVVRLDMTVTGDGATRLRAVAGGMLLPDDGAGNASAVLRNRTGVDPGPATELVMFSTTDGATTNTSYVGAILHTDAGTDAAVAGVQDATDSGYVRQRVDGQRVYAPTNRSGYWIGVLGDGELVVGTRPAVTDAVAVAAGNGDRVGGPLRTAYDGARDGTVQFATTSPAILLPPEADSVTNVQLYRDLRAVGGAYYLDGRRTGVEAELRATSPNNARSVAEATNGSAAVLRNSLDNESAVEAVDAVEIDRRGSTVTLSYEAPIETFERVVRYIYGVELS